jgi:hypothetical protein
MRRVLGVLLFLFSACGGKVTETPQDAGTQTATTALVLGGGLDDGSPGFVGLTDGQDVPLVAGAQGGFHVYLNVRIEEAAMTPNRSLFIDRRARREDTDQLVSQNRQLITFVEAPESGYFDSERPMLMFLCPAPIGIQVHDKTLSVRVNARVDHNTEELLAEGTVRFTPRCPTGDQEEFCRSICSGE